jgi:DNA polymerase elongation subunit (family B)
MYVDAIKDNKKDIIKVVERHDGKRVYTEYPAEYKFYYPDSNGKHQSIYGDRLDCLTFKSKKEFNISRNAKSHLTLFESDINPVFRCLSSNYMDAEVPKLNIAFFDIEVDFDKDLGYADPSDPFNPITAIGVHLNWINETICFVIKPNTLTKDEALSITSKFNNTFLYDTEKELLEDFLNIIDDADVLSGWNSTGYDIPYLVNRVTRVLSHRDTSRFCLWDQIPRKREYERYGKTQETFDLVGRVHLDYMDLYKQYTYQEMASYSLDSIGEHELSERKIAYEGTLDQLYNQDFHTFIDYNRQDVELLRKLDDKLQYIELANAIAHDNTVLLQSTMGAVAVTDQAIVNEAHSLGMVVPDKQKNKIQIHYPFEVSAAGAYVAHPKKGFHKDIGSMDLKSLYPSILRSLNMSPETIVGQIRHTLTVPMLESFDWKIPEAWDGKFACPEYDLVMNQDTKTPLWIDFENGEELSCNGKEIYEIIFNGPHNWVLSANGTIIDQTKTGVIPGLLTRWYNERKVMQAKAKEFDGVDSEQHAFWDKRQLVKKINLNSLYGAILNAGSRFNDPRIGQSTTLTGRGIARHMAAQVNEVFTGKYDHIGETIIYGDTDSLTGDAIIETSNGRMTISELYDQCSKKIVDTSTEKSYGYDNNIQVLSYDNETEEPYFGNINYVYKHPVNKQLYNIEDEYGNMVTVTEDHSIMIERDGVLMEAKPLDICENDIVISVDFL